MDITDTWQELVIPGGKIAYLVMDGLGGLASAETGRTALDSAETPNLDALARDSSCGLLEMVGPGITPGSGPGHLSLFGYDPLRWRIGRACPRRSGSISRCGRAIWRRGSTSRPSTARARSPIAGPGA